MLSLILLLITTNEMTCTKKDVQSTFQSIPVEY